MHLSAIKKQTSDCSFYFIKFVLWYFSNLEIWNHDKKGKKESNSIVLAFIADVSVSTNPSMVEIIIFQERTKRIIMRSRIA